jgi:hypothetical protein
MKTFKQHLDEAGRCWPGYEPVPGKKKNELGSCRKEEVEELEEERPGLWANIRAKRARGEKMRKPGSEGAPTDAQIKAIRASEEVEHLDEYESKGGVYKHQAKLDTRSRTETIPFRDLHNPGNKLDKSGTTETDKNMGIKWGKKETQKVTSKKTLMNVHKNLPEQIEQIDEDGAWTRKEGQSESGGLNRKGIESYRRENPGSKLSMAVTTKPSKLDPDSKAAKRRKSFCARMGGMKKRLTSAETARDPDSRINKALRKWNC